MSGYRALPPHCPACGTLLAERDADGSTVEVCPECQGIFIDWFDGELSAIAGQVGPLPWGSAVERRGRGLCPKCSVPLLETTYGEGGIAVLRCSECIGAFVPRAALEALVALGPPEPKADQPSPLAKLLAWLQRQLQATTPTPTELARLDRGGG